MSVCMCACGFTTGCQFFPHYVGRRRFEINIFLIFFYFCKLILQLFSLGLVACQGGHVDRLTGTLVRPITLHFSLHGSCSARLRSAGVQHMLAANKLGATARSQQELGNIFIFFLLLFIKRHMRGRTTFIWSVGTLRCLEQLEL